MDYENGDRTPADLTHVADRLRASRVTATPLELDELKLRARRQAARRRSPGGTLMKSRLALTALIVIGVMMSGTGATLAITGSSGSGSAEENQYDTPTTETTPTGPKATLAPQQVAGDQEEGDVSPTAESAPTEQVEAAADSGDSLPFTGFLAIPLLIGGVALTAVGGVLRRRSRDSD